jgi:hypothetical protein
VAVRTRVNILDSVRLALPRSPESGIAVSSGAKTLSREKRKMWVPYRKNVLCIVVSFHAQDYFLIPSLARERKKVSRSPDFERAKTDDGLRDRLIFLANGNDWIFSGAKF